MSNQFIKISEIITQENLVFFGLGFVLCLVAALVFVLLGRVKTAGRLVALESREQILQQQAAQLREENQVLLDEVRNRRENEVRLQAEKEAFAAQIAQHKNDVKAMEEVLAGKFENLSNRIFEEKSENFKKQSRENLGAILDPLREKMAEFQKKVDDSFGQQSREQFSLKEQIKNIVEVNERVKLQAEDLAKAIKGESKTQGNWGEVLLEKILEDSGLRPDVDYILQATNMGLRHVETGNVQRPDVVIMLPDDKHVIVDSKVSLTHYERYFSGKDDEARALHLNQFLASVKTHVKDLEARRYQDTDKLGTPDFVLMFMPIEGAYALAMQQDHELHAYAWDKKVVIVCPTTLFATLRTVASVWRMEKQNKNVQEIARQGGALYDKISLFVDDMQKLGTQLKTVEKTYDETMNKLYAGKGNILGRTEKLKQLGAKSSKALPVDLLEMVDEFEEQDAPEKLRA